MTSYSVSAYCDAATEDVLAASKVGESAGAVAASAGGLDFDFDVINAGWATGDLLKPDALSVDQVSELI